VSDLLNPTDKDEKWRRIHQDYGRLYFEESISSLERWLWSLQEANVCRLVDRLASEPDSIAYLDIGCGTGSLCERLPRLGSYIGIEALEYIQQRAIAHPKSRVVLSTAEEMDAHVESSSIDVCIIKNSLDHFVDPQRVMAHIFKALKAGGWLIISNSNSEAWTIRLRKLLHREVTDDNHIQDFDAPKMRELLLSSGLSPVSFSSYGFGVAPSFLSRLGPYQLVDFVLTVQERIISGASEYGGRIFDMSAKKVG